MPPLFHTTKAAPNAPLHVHPSKRKVNTTLEQHYYSHESRPTPSRKRKQEPTLRREREHGHEYEHKHEHEHECKNKKTTMRVVRIHVWDPYATDDSSSDDENNLE